MTTRFHRAVVTGDAGFVGSHLCERLLADGTEVLRHDAREPIRLPGAVDLVLHFASPASPAEYLRDPLDALRVGADGTRLALDFAVAKGARFVLASASDAYGGPPHPRAEGFAEALTETYRERLAADTGIVRIVDTYGPGMRPDDGRAVPTFVVQALRGEPVTVAGDGSRTRSICHVSDTVAGLLALARSPVPGPIDIGNPEEMTVLELAERIVRLAGSDSTIRFVPRPGGDPEVRPDVAPATRLLGWRPQVGWREGLTDTVGWFASR
jgi:dTDP-glucose 4,6-dehydratase